jgi:hypothetical protein
MSSEEAVGGSEQAWQVGEYGARDPEGRLWFFHSPLDQAI